MAKAKTIRLPVAKDMIAVPMSTAENAINPKESNMREMKWKSEDALRDIERAEGHKRDPELMKHVKKLAKEKVASLKKIC